jgi:2-polyprenyl-6-methoxyphenol hydroxylase-like FAD-dependent oxidoreductase
MSTPHRVGSLNFYHPDMQSVVLDAAARAGATVRRGVRVSGLACDSPCSVCVHEDGNGDRIYRARLLVGADGRNSACRRWGGFRVERDTEGMIISGLLLKGLRAPEDRLISFLNPRRGMLSLTVPIGQGRFRTYICIHKSSSEFSRRPISGRAGISDFVAASIAAGASELV